MRLIPLTLTFMLALAACQTNEPTLAPQPEHTVNPVPAPVYTRHHTDADSDKPTQQAEP